MNAFSKFISTGLVLVGVAFSGAVEAKNTVIGLSPFGEPAKVRQNVDGLARYLATNVDPGETAHILDAHGLKLIGTFAVPNKAAYSNPRAKVAVNKTVLRAMFEFAASARGDGDLVGRIDMPGLLRYVGTNYPANGKSDLIVLGSPVHHDPRIATLSMRGARVPNDGHIKASRAQSPYGTAGLQNRLKGYRVLLGIPSMDWAATDRHAYFTQRFLSLMIAAQGGQLTTFTTDLGTLFQQAAKPLGGPLEAYSLTATDKLEMIAFKPETAALSIYERELSRQVPARSALRRAEQVEIGISWDCGDCDLDLFARPGLHGEVIFYGKPVTATGRLFKDYQQSPAITGGFETIAFAVPVDLTTLRLAINFYAGKVPQGGVTGEIRIAIGNHTWAKRFGIAANAGNKGKDANAVMKSGQASNKAWVVVDPVNITGNR